MKNILIIGRGSISKQHQDNIQSHFDLNIIENSDFEPIELPAPRSHLIKEGLSDKFIEYMGAWPGFVGE